ncbi:hypothetical protein V502_04965 [Pseudogymnoascus sp. VKM F-4520 (FW-2644)]|nr:hypothetical protein V502_04965 [Pseudogymnoascus sp. VKM F-4520 (FW-2644)]
MRAPHRITRVPALPQILPPRHHERLPLLPNPQRIDAEFGRAIAATQQSGPVTFFLLLALVGAAVALGRGGRAVYVNTASGVGHVVLLRGAGIVVCLAAELLGMRADHDLRVMETKFAVGVDDEDVLLAEEEGAVDDAG